MVTFLIASNVLAMIAVALAFRAKAVVVVAPLLAILTTAVLLLGGRSLLDTLIWLCICLAAGQAAFLLTSAIEWFFVARRSSPRAVSATPEGDGEKTSLATGPTDYSPRSND